MKRSGFIVIIAFFISIYALRPSMANPDFWKFEWPQTDFSKSSVDFVEIISGGPPKDGIPSIDNPNFLPVKDINALDEHELVISLSLNGETKAYPIRILIRHEIVNDTVGGVPVIVTYCPLCNAAIVFERTVNGEVTEFGVTGKLRFSDMLMYDRASESWWQQFSGKAIIGSRMGMTLTTIPSRTESWSRFAKRNPQAKVLVPDTFALHHYDLNPYRGYDTSHRPFLFNGELPENIPPLAYVILIKDTDKPFIMSLDKLRKEKSIKRNGITLTWTDGTRSALDTQKISQGRQIGNVIAKRGKDDIAYDLTFAFVTHAFMPEIEIEQ